MKPTLRQYRIFVATAESGSLSRASEAIFISQAAASMALRTMEDALNKALFERHGKRLEITDYGRWLLPRAKRMLDLAAEITAGPSGHLSGQLLVGASQTVANQLLAACHADFLAAHPQVQIQLQAGNSQSICEQLMNHRLEMAVIEDNPHLPGLEFTPWQTDELVVLAHPGHPLAGRAAVEKSQLLECDWLLREPGSGTRAVLERALGEMFEKLRCVQQSNHPQTLLALSATGMGLVCISRRSAAQHLQQGTLVTLNTCLPLTRQLYIAQRKGEQPSQLGRAYLALLLDKKSQAPLRPTTLT